MLTHPKTARKTCTKLTHYLMRNVAGFPQHADYLQIGDRHEEQWNQIEQNHLQYKENRVCFRGPSRGALGQKHSVYFINGGYCRHVDHFRDICKRMSSTNLTRFELGRCQNAFSRYSNLIKEMWEDEASLNEFQFRQKLHSS
ncbi:hypothetical protein TcasGA2_TC009078 [Tribolium castaneum]|uniref:Uncharacterized protein n=1 Tax=Tribolium castaneum TaxID=7070 RepID=D6WPG6_TRICA|nr:hypothetical protein TcasGA2_TC009078 [Tribolium castaneum]